MPPRTAAMLCSSAAPYLYPLVRAHNGHGFWKREVVPTPRHTRHVMLSWRHASGNLTRKCSDMGCLHV
eukprot:16671-Eustigmatos_ZCMA.PRE.1